LHETAKDAKSAKDGHGIEDDESSPCPPRCALTYHLDGTTALQHLETLLGIEALDAIEWTPQAGKPGGGSPEWYGLYRRVLAAGKSVQAIGARPEEVVPLIEAVGPKGLFILTGTADQASAEALLAAVEPYRR
jgi:hypothetical protein